MRDTHRWFRGRGIRARTAAMTLTGWRQDRDADEFRGIADKASA
jgi:hypothetical protein